MFHWNTTSLAEHKAFGATYDALNGLIDDFVETHIGIHGRTENKAFTLEIPAFGSMAETKKCISEFEECLESMTDEISRDTDLLNIRDSILGEVSHLRYLLTLK
jgi:hypothetical protein